MNPSQHANTTNGIARIPQKGIIDERTPLLKGRDEDSRGLNAVIGEVSPYEADAEAARCESPLVDKVPSPETPRNVAGVISILLLGKWRNFLSIARSSSYSLLLPLRYSPPCTPFPPRQLIASVGVFIANADSSLVLATSGTISSEFDQLEDAGWLITSYTLAMCATQSLVGSNTNPVHCHLRLTTSSMAN